MSRRVFTKDFKLNAVKLANQSNKSKAQIARDLGIRENVLYNWCKNYREQGEKCFDSNRSISSEEAELSRLRSEISELKMEREILKKALAIFSKK